MLQLRGHKPTFVVACVAVIAAFCWAIVQTRGGIEVWWAVPAYLVVHVIAAAAVLRSIEAADERAKAMEHWALSAIVAAVTIAVRFVPALQEPIPSDLRIEEVREVEEIPEVGEVREVPSL